MDVATVTTTTTTYEISYLYILAFFLLVGFLYHYIKTKEYRKTVKGSILIGSVLGGIYGVESTLSILVILIWILGGIILVLMGGLIAVALKKILKCSD